jgi:hypothetical protein
MRNQTGCTERGAISRWNGVDEKQEIMEALRVFDRAGRGRTVGLRGASAEFEVAPGGGDQLAQRSRGRVPVTALVGRDDRLTRAGPSCDLSLGQSAPDPSGAEECSCVHDAMVPVTYRIVYVMDGWWEEAEPRRAPRSGRVRAIIRLLGSWTVTSIRCAGRVRSRDEPVPQVR